MKQLNLPFLKLFLIPMKITIFKQKIYSTNISYMKIKYLTKKQEKFYCISGIIRQENTECKYTKTYTYFQINYVKHDILLTWNIPKTL